LDKTASSAVGGGGGCGKRRVVLSHIVRCQGQGQRLDRLAQGRELEHDRQCQGQGHAILSLRHLEVKETASRSPTLAESS